MKIEKILTVTYRTLLTKMTLFKFIWHCVLYQFHRQTLPIMKIDRAKSNFESMFLQERNLGKLNLDQTALEHL